jgi:diaminohydroxyphosphoribosylaminopyrimidine deaminase/5-amino-6-(5-phosphoribosylamino)uracil reductase
MPLSKASRRHGFSKLPTLSDVRDAQFMRRALRLARRGFGTASPNPMVGAILVKGGKIIGQGWHHRAGLPHGEIEALNDARKRKFNPKGATLYVTLEPCSTHGRTPPCTEAIIAAGIQRVVIGTIDPNPRHAGKALKILKRAGIEVATVATIDPGLAKDCERLNEAFNHWIVHRTPFITVKAAMTLDGKIATASGESKWITSETSREFAMNLRLGVDAIVAGVNTILNDNPSLTLRLGKRAAPKQLRRIILDSQARTPLTSKVVSDEFASQTTVVVTADAPESRVGALSKRVNVLVVPRPKSKQQKAIPPLPWLLKKLGAENIASVLVEGGGEVNGSFLLGGLAQRVAFFYAPKIVGGRDARKAVAGEGVQSLKEVIGLREMEWRKLGRDLFMTARVDMP